MAFVTRRALVASIAWVVASTLWLAGCWDVATLEHNTTPLTTSQDVRLNSPFGGNRFYRVSTNLSRDDLGGYRISLGGGLTFRPTPRWQASLDPSFSRSTDARQYVTSVADSASTATFGRRYVFAFVDRVTISHVRSRSVKPVGTKM